MTARASATPRFRGAAPAALGRVAARPFHPHVLLRGAGVIPAATTVVLACAAPCGAEPSTGWGARVSVNGGVTSAAFPGSAYSTPDRFAALTAGLSNRLRLAPRLRLEGSAAVTAERFERWAGRDLDRWEGELRAHAGGLRARVRGRYSPRVLLFDDNAGGAFYRSREALGGLDWRAAHGLLASIELRGEQEAYDAAHAGRTQTRTRWGYLAGWEPGAGRSISMQFENEHALADDPNYDFWSNGLTFAAGLEVSGVAARLEVGEGVRNYFTGSIFTSNWRRQDRTGAYRLALRRPLGPVDVELRDEVITRTSTRSDHSYRVNTVGVGLSWSLGR